MKNKINKFDIFLKDNLDKINKNEKCFKSNLPLSGDHYFNTYSSSIGNKKLKRIFFNIHIFHYYIRNVFSFFFIKEIEISKKKIITNKILISFASIDNFKVTKEFSWGKEIFSKHNEEYFPIKKKNIKKVLIYRDQNLIKKTDKNIIFFYQIKKINIFNKLIYLKYILKHNSIKDFFCYINAESYFAYYFFKIIKKNINLNKMKKVFISYEGQPFQKYFISELKKINKKCKVISYDHALDAFPINLLYNKNFSPDLLMVHSKDQFKSYNRHLNWPKKKLMLIKSLRFSKKRAERLKSALILPYDIDKNKAIKYTYIYEKFLSKINFRIAPLKILLHPQKKSDPSHIFFLKKLHDINKKSKRKFSILNSKKINVIFGNSSSVIESLEFNSETYHIVIDIEIEIYSNMFWPNIEKIYIDSNIYKYKKLKQNHSLVWK
jgi:hypothetical protein